MDITIIQSCHASPNMFCCYIYPSCMSVEMLSDIKPLHGSKKVYRNGGNHWRTDRILWGKLRHRCQQAAGTMISLRKSWWFKFYWLHAISSAGPLVSAGSLFYSSMLREMLHCSHSYWDKGHLPACYARMWADMVHPLSVVLTRCRSTPGGQRQYADACQKKEHAKQLLLWIYGTSSKHYWSINPPVEGNAMACVWPLRWIKN